ncbi:hypothetical protein ACFY9A_40120 [Streptomyces rubradiris]|uniref:hypothetical protein n=1 Tax=Streptomyces rubradiris TaxID=285531 RepID=UPI0036E7B18B
MSSPTPPPYAASSNALAAAAPVRRFKPALAVALVAGFVLGAGGTGAAWAFSGSDDSVSGASGDARHACDALQGFHESDNMSDATKRNVAFNRLAGAVVLSAAAAASDREFKPLADAMQQVQNQQVRFADFTDPEPRKDLKAARDLCSRL